MKNLIPSMKLKVKRDTFYLPDPGRGIYLRNNTRSLHMKGKSIDQWIEKLIPMFNGKYSLEKLTNGLPDIYRNRVYEIAEVLYRNGFVQDVSKDLPHQLSDEILEKYASQIEFLQNLADSGEYRFQMYRQKKVLAIGSGPIFVSLISSLLESGLPRFQVLITDSAATNRKRIGELLKYAQKIDPETEIKELSISDKGLKQWKKIIRPFDAILYVSQEGNIEELRHLNRICLEEEKILLPALILENAGLAGPLIHPDSTGCFESLWRSIHRSVLSYPSGQTYSAPAGAMLSNIIVFELFKKMTGITSFERQNKFFLLNLETLEGNWHLFMPHPLVTEQTHAKWVEDIHSKRKENVKKVSKEQESRLIFYFDELTSTQAGIFHLLGEEDLVQLPLSQCRVQTIDPLSEGPAELLPSIVCADFTHYLARKEAGLTGLEAYVSRMKDFLMRTLPKRKILGEKVEENKFVGFGAGETFAEAVCRGLQKCLEEELQKYLCAGEHDVVPLELSALKDKQCDYYLQALTTMHGAPIIGAGEELFGFPVIWVGTKRKWFVSTGLNTTLALRKALVKALISENNNEQMDVQSLDRGSVLLKDKVQRSIIIHDFENFEHSSLLKSSMDVIEENNKRLITFVVEMEPILKKELLCVYGVLLQEEESL